MFPSHSRGHWFDPSIALRHTFVVPSLSAGTRYMAVSMRLGRESYVTTLTIYADFISDDEGAKRCRLHCRSCFPSRCRVRVV